MNPFYFGTSAEPLFGVYHPPRSSSARRMGVLLCYPVGQEYMKAHRAFRQLALLLSRAGFHVMRFDYYGTGDSAGESDVASIDHCAADVETAVEELGAMSGESAVAVVGLRLGATIAALAASRISGLSHLVLWDPVTDGAQYVRELVGERVGPGGGSSRGSDVCQLPDTVGVLGFPVTARMREDIRALEVLALPPASAAECLVIVSSQEEQYRRFYDAFRKRAAVTTFAFVPNEGNWNEVDQYGSALIPQAVIRKIVDHLAERVP